METRQILKYRRDRDRWVCAECDTENEMTVGRCIVCGSVKSPGAVILKTWTAADDRPPVPPRPPVPQRKIQPIQGPIFKDDGYVPEKEKSGAGILWTILAILVIVFFLIVGLGLENGVFAKTSNEESEFSRTDAQMSEYLLVQYEAITEEIA